MRERKIKTPTYQVISTYRTLLMGLGMISIVVFHYAQDRFLAEYHYGETTAFVNEIISSAGVEVFLLLSGFGCYYAFNRYTGETLTDFFRKRIIRVMIPYLVIAVPIWALYDLWAKHSLSLFLRDLSFITFFTDNVTSYWYILISIICYLMTPWLVNLANSAKDRYQEQMYLLILLCSFAVLAVTIKTASPDMYKNTNIMLLRFYWYVIGIFMGKASWEKRQMSVLYWFFPFLTWAMVSLMIPDSNSLVGRPLRGAYLIAWLIFLVMILSNLPKESVVVRILQPLKKIIEWFGRYSLEWYLLHITLRKLMKYVGHSTAYGRNELIMLMLVVILIIPYSRICKALVRRLEVRRSE